jgi:HSP20 family protein
MNTENWKHSMDLIKKVQKQQFMQKFLEHSSLSQNSSFLHQKELFPLCDVYQHGECLYVEVELPGLTQEEIRVTLNQQKLIIKGNYHTLNPSCNYYLKERRSKTFEKEIHLPFPISKINIRHYFQNGLLKIVLPIESDEENIIPVSPDNQNTD